MAFLCAAAAAAAAAAMLVCACHAILVPSQLPGALPFRLCFAFWHEPLCAATVTED